MEIDGLLEDWLLLLKGSALRISGFIDEITRYGYINAKDLEYINTLILHVNDNRKKLITEIDKRRNNGD